MKETVFECETNFFILSIKGDIEGREEKYLHRIGKSRGDKAANVEYRVSEPVGSLKIGGAEVVPDASGVVLAPPVFFETNYFIRVKMKIPVKRVQVKHALAEISDAFDFSDQLLVGQVNFINTPGKFKLVLCLETEAGAKEFALEFFVVSVKMDVQRDYVNILERINQDHESLVFSFLSKTLGGAKYACAKEEVSGNTTYQIFDGVFEFYKNACEKVIHQPHLKYIRQVSYRKADHIRRWTPALAQRFHALPEERRAVDYFRTEKIDSEVDSPENRFVLYTLNELTKLLLAVEKNLNDNPSVSRTFLEHVKRQRIDLGRLAAYPFFKHIGRFRGFRQESLVLQKRQGYARIYAIWLLLKKALEPNGFDLDVGYRPISALYEFWCFLKMHDVLTDMFGDPGKPEPGIKPEDLWNDLEENNQSLTTLKYVFKDEKERREIELSYQKNYGTNEAEENFAYLNAQRPDIVVSIKDFDGTVFTYLFDAKYRVEAREKLDASPRGAIDDMHRYRDAIMYRVRKEGVLKHEIVGAYVLYPGQVEKSFDYSRCIAEENIGAIALLPTDDSALKSFLNGIFEKQGVQEHLREAIAPRGTEIRFEEDESVLIVREEGERKKLILVDQRTNEILYPYPMARKEEIPQRIDFILFVKGGMAKILYRVEKVLMGLNGKTVDYYLAIERQYEEQTVLDVAKHPHNERISRRIMEEAIS